MGRIAQPKKTHGEAGCTSEEQMTPRETMRRNGCQIGKSKELQVVVLVVPGTVPIGRKQADGCG